MTDLPDPEHLAKLTQWAADVNEGFAAKGERDVTRVPLILAKLHVYWQQNPHLRLGQIIGNCANESRIDPYYMEDDVIEQWLTNVATPSLREPE